MQVFHGFHEAASQIPPLVYAIGNFDGVHLGHVSLLLRAREIATIHGVDYGVFTFWPHPRAVLRPSSSLQLITTREQKMRRFEELGVKYVVEQPFTMEFAVLSGNAFCKDVLALSLKAEAVVTGENFHFGHHAAGTAQKMAEWLNPYGIEHALTPSIFVNGELCSSSRIRDAVLHGKIESANAMLGRHYSLVGNVVKGAGRGKSIGVPTANLKAALTLIPAGGVYATTVRIGDKEFNALTNIGTRPTFSDCDAIHIETHLLDFDQEIYGAQMEIFFLKKIRDEKHFASIEELKKQIQDDIYAARK
jgi:riboflavin kinase/FMN adenylyltransferase